VSLSPVEHIQALQTSAARARFTHAEESAKVQVLNLTKAVYLEYYNGTASFKFSGLDNNISLSV
jgi:hypothetical protein